MRLLLLTMLAASAALVRPGDASLDASRVVAGSDTLVVATTGGGAPGIIGTVTLDTRRENGAVHRAERFVSLDATLADVDSFALDAQTLAPLGTDAQTFHPNSVDLVLASLPLADGYTATLAVVGESVAVDAVRADTVRTVAGDACAAWRVDVTESGQRALYWIGQARPVLVQYLSPQDGILFTRTRGCG